MRMAGESQSQPAVGRVVINVITQLIHKPAGRAFEVAPQ